MDCKKPKPSRGGARPSRRETMCMTGSGANLEDGRVLMLDDSDSHGDIVDRYHLKDIFIGRDRTFVKFEIIPRDGGSLSSTNPEDWEYQLDQDDNDPLPDWYNKEIASREAMRVFLGNIKKGRYDNTWQGNIYIPAKRTVSAPKLTECGGVDVYENATFTAPKLKK